MRYHEEGVPLVVFAGKEYGTGSSRDWAAKGPRLLGVRAVIAESFERIHRSNLIGMGVLPLVFAEGISWRSLGLKGDETVSLGGLERASSRCSGSRPRSPMRTARSARLASGRAIDTFDELDYFRNGGILPYVLRSLARGGLSHSRCDREPRHFWPEISARFLHAMRHEPHPPVERRRVCERFALHRRRRAEQGRGAGSAREQGGARALHQPGLLVLPAGRCAAGRARKEPGPRDAVLLRRLLELSRLARHAFKPRQ